MQNQKNRITVVTLISKYNVKRKIKQKQDNKTNRCYVLYTCFLRFNLKDCKEDNETIEEGNEFHNGIIFIKKEFLK